MTTLTGRRFSLTTIVKTIAISALSVIAAASCTAGSGDADSEELVGAAEEVGTQAEGVSGTIAVGSTLQSTTNVNLRTGPSTSKAVLVVVPEGAKVTVVESAPSNGFYKVKHNGTVGWSYGTYYKLVAPPADQPGSGGSSGPRATAITRAKAGVGFSYWWGHGRWKAEGATSSNKGSCSGSCPDCDHSGSYGADCSGYVAKIWQVPSSNAELNVDQHPYSTASFNKDSSQWSTISRSNLVQGDALVYNTNGAGHIVLYDKGDGWGSMYAYECKGCSAGCVYNVRTASSSYHAIRRAGW